MKYILLMVVDESAWESLAPDQMQPMIDAMETYNRSLRDGGAWVSGEGYDFSRNARTVRVRNGERSVEDGPAIDSKPQVGGHWIIEADSMADAVTWATKIPMTNGAIEVRGLVPA